MRQIICLALFFIFPVTVVLAQTAEQRGLEIVQEIDRRDTGWRNAVANIKMVLNNRQGEQSMRSIRIKVLEVDGDGDKSLTIFDDPNDIKGTAFLSFSHAIKPDDQWLYLPALKRVKRISSANKSGPFMGSEFAYEDLASFEVDKYHYKFLREEKINELDTYVIESYPQYKYSGYTRLVSWIDKQRYIPLKAEFYDRKNDLLKILNYKNYKQYQDRYWRAHEQIMENYQNGKKTLLTLSDYQFGIGLSDRDFGREKLRRAR